MMRLSYRSPKTEVRESKIHGRGLFATADIAKDEIVAVKGGHIVDRETLREKITSRLGPVEIQIDDDLFIAPVTDEEWELSMLYSNHSCNANLGMRGEITFVTMRNIRAGEELTHDWAMTDDDDYFVECKCGAPNCNDVTRAISQLISREKSSRRRLTLNANVIGRRCTSVESSVFSAGLNSANVLADTGWWHWEL